MASIKYVHLLNSFVSTEGSSGFMTNYIYYSVLVVYDNGAREIVEGQRDQIRHLVPYIVTPQDELLEVKETVKGLRDDITAIVDEKMKAVIDSLYPVPDVQGLNESEAIELIEKAGLRANLVYSYPEDTPKTGRIEAFRRRQDNFKTVDLEIVHDMPDVKGLHLEEAVRKLHEAGMKEGNITYKAVTDGMNGVVLQAYRSSPDSLDIHMEVSAYVPEVTGMNVDEAKELLRKNGYDCTITERPDKNDPDKVLEWQKADDHTIRLVVSMSQQRKCRSADVRWNNMADSTGDEYLAAAYYDNRFKELVITVTSSLNVKSKHKLIQVRGMIGGLTAVDVKMRPFVSTLETCKGAEYQFTISKDMSDLPEKVSIILETQYGIVKKTDDITLDITLTW